MMLRMFRALVNRAADGDTEALEVLAGLEREAASSLTLAVRRAHSEAGYSFTELGAVLGVSRQAARQRVSVGNDQLERVVV